MIQIQYGLQEPHMVNGFLWIFNPVGNRVHWILTGVYMKYILVEWPDIQLVMEDPEYESRVYTGFSINSESDAAYFVPEDLY